MKVTPIAHGLDLLKSDLVRSDTLHASTVYNSLFSELEPDRYKQDDGPPDLLMALGTAWEKHLEYLLIANGVKAERPEEFLSPEGIAYSPDLLLFNGTTRLGEIKLSYQSSKSYPTEVTNSLSPKADKWLCQMMLYAYWLGLTEGLLLVLFVCGNYERPYKPELRFFELAWTDRDLQDNHTMLMNHARAKGML